MIIPSIDIQEGKAVQLKQGKEKMLEHDDPAGLADEFSRFGEIAVIDLDAAMNRGSNLEVIRNICRKASCRVGGGIRSLEKAREVADMGAEKLIFGTRAFRSSGVDHDFMRRIENDLGRDRIIVALDTAGEKIVTRGWRENTGIGPLKAARELEPYASEFLMTCVDREGLMEGTNIEFFSRLREAVSIEITAAGGVKSLKEIRDLSRKGLNVQLGMALYTGKISLPQAFSASLDWRRGLLPTVTRDTSGRVLMLAYSSRESLHKTFQSGCVWYYSRSRKRLWKKGETSGHVQKFLDIRSDCDGDALLITADQTGPACHKGRYSCFGSKRFSPQDLTDVIQSRIQNPSSESYTASLKIPEVKDKIREEAKELIEAREKDDIIWEAADLFYFVNVWLARNDLGFDEVIRELGRRRKQKRRK